MKPIMIVQTITTVPDENVAKTVIDTLAKKNLFACAQTKPIVSTYYWDKKWISEPEIEISFKHAEARTDQLHKALKEIHPYDVPQIISVHVDSDGEYKKWVESISQIE